MKRRIAFFSVSLLVLFVIGSASLYWRIASLREPVYAGKTLGEWLAGRITTNKFGGWAESKEADDAFRKIGTNGIPTLLRMLEAHRYPVQRVVKPFLARRGIIKRTYREAGYQVADAMHGFSVLGPAAASAVPDLIRIYQNADLNYVTRGCAVTALGYIGPPAQAAIPLLLRDLESTNEHTLCDAVSALAKIRGDPGVVVPALAKVLQQTNSAIRWHAVEGLGLFRGDAEDAVPELLAAFEKAGPPSPSELRQAIDTALWRISPEKIPMALREEIPLGFDGAPERLEFEIDGRAQPIHFSEYFRWYYEEVRSAEDPRDGVRLYRGWAANRRLLAGFEVLGLPPKPEPVQVRIFYGLAGGQLFLWARKTDDHEPVEIRRVNPR